MSNSEKPASLLEVYTKIKTVCEAHVGIAQFDSGAEIELPGNSYSYPLAYLEETPLVQTGEKKRTHSYSLALSILDLIPKDCDAATRIQVQDKCFQLFNETYQYLMDKVFGRERVGEFTLAITPDFTNDNTMRLRAEFQVTVGNPFTSQTPTTDLLALFPTLA